MNPSLREGRDAESTHGQAHNGDPTVFGLTREDVADLNTMPVPAFLVVHPKVPCCRTPGLAINSSRLTSCASCNARMAASSTLLACTHFSPGIYSDSSGAHGLATS